MRTLTFILFFLFAAEAPTPVQQQPSEKVSEAITVRHSPNSTKGYLWRRPDKWIGYKWPYRTEVRNNLDVPLQITHFGFYCYKNGKWVLENLSGRLYTSADFSERYSDEDSTVDGWILPGKVAVNADNWNTWWPPAPPPRKWTYTAKDSAGNIYHAEEEIGLTPVFYRFHAGDDTAWAKPEFDDSAWEQNQFTDFAYHNRPRRGWLRSALEVDSTLWNVPLGISIGYVGAVEFYLDGKLLYQIGNLGASIEDEQANLCCSGGPDPRIITFPRPIHVTGATSRHVFAIRYSSFTLDLPVLSDWRPHLGFYLGDHNEMTAQRNNVQRKGARHQMFLVGVYLALAVIHFLLFWFYPKLRANLYFAILGFSAVFFTYFQLLDWFFISMPITSYVWYTRLFSIATGIMYLAILRFTYSVIYPSLPKSFIVIAILGAGLIIWGWFRPFLQFEYGAFFIIFICLEILRAIVFSRMKKRQLIYEGSWIILLGMIFLMLGIIYQYASEDFNLITPLWDDLDFPTPFYASLLLMLSMSIFLSRNFARTNINLEVQLEKVSAIEREVRRTRDVFRLFVPDAILDRIAKQGLESIKLGGAEEGIATILFTDIRSFTTIAEKLSPNDTLAFLNEFMQRMEPVIHQNGGFINQFVGDEIMAIFYRSGHEDAAIATAIGLRQALNEHNRRRTERGEPPIDIGVGVNTGKVIWGTIGSEVRMESAIIGDTVNLASRLQNLTKNYGVGVLVSESVFREISNPERFCYREIDVVQVRGKTKPVVVYEIFDADSDLIKTKKRNCLSQYNRGLHYFHAEDWQQAMSLFESCLEIFPEDPISRLYIERCRAHLANSPGNKNG